jgi:hypothetical protein
MPWRKKNISKPIIYKKLEILTGSSSKEKMVMSFTSSTKARWIASEEKTKT